MIIITIGVDFFQFKQINQQSTKLFCSLTYRFIKDYLNKQTSKYYVVVKMRKKHKNHYIYLNWNIQIEIAEVAKKGEAIFYISSIQLQQKKINQYQLRVQLLEF
ncbi:unnamed protein product [Paramecium pentaurelia]|uniref:Uncharacterized protein n=1 Tax=Paramecium pentaurelia TaxID=43138 RepID=A0A8S1UHM2_9CILI|nr:unnamed protein product [Paramecium pentaurelia]